ncbi:uncharacterized protein LOC125576153 [Brassica napus]|uniref:uncharacterized protein LOC125576153 n=1 Tax=Brassica napus TaxID=3708 RepID=UPI0020787EF5|nr:uncharacterized protein LOC125576153 [Brassica napus]
MAAKTDMSKAFDRVEWHYLQALLLSLGFDNIWVKWIMSCVTTVTYSVLLNGQSYGYISPQRGLRQGDPISPFLFVLCTEGLTHMMNQASLRGDLKGIQFNLAGPEVHHFFFADDSLFLFKAELSQCQVFQDILLKYGEATGQVINLSKSSLTFGKNTCPSLKAQIKSKLGIYSEGGAGSYLGLPECFSGSKVEMLAYIQDKMKGRMSGWYSRFLSQAGKDVILKSVAMAMPIYAMTCFKLPKTTCNNLKSAMAAFWWQASEDKSKIHWLSWDKLCISKEMGGMGFKDIELFNQALLAKQAWRILTNQDSLLTRFLQSRYFSNGSFLSATLGSRPSYAWRSILHGRELLEKGLRNSVGNGLSISVWSTPWLIDGERLRIPLMKNILVDLNLKVSDLMIPNSDLWDHQKLENLFYDQDIEIILKIKPAVSSPDFLCWNHTRSGEYSVKSGYWFAEKEAKKEAYVSSQALPSLNGIKSHIWSLNTAPKIKVFLWKVIGGAISVADHLIERGMKVDSRCQICGLEGESMNHVLFNCTIARQSWAICHFPAPVNGFDPSSIYSNIFYVLKMGNNQNWPVHIRRSGPWILWQIWKNRNSFLFKGSLIVGSKFATSLLQEADHWFLIKEMEKQEQAIDLEKKKRIIFGWKPPPSSWFKCDIGFDWDKNRKESGAAWILRNAEGKVLLHGRRSFSNIRSKSESSFQSWLWALESMKSLHFDHVIFSAEDRDIVNAISKPATWPSLKAFSFKLIEMLHEFLFWQVESQSRQALKPVFLIANSVIKEDLFQSYIASGFPGWLKKFFS